jgi:DNA (cytosine-5)-methyltransferase 3A
MKVEKQKKKPAISPLTVLSLFDGISCGRLALSRAKIPVKQYFASEIDKQAIKIASAHYPDNINVGDVSQLQADVLPKIDLLIGGSPCQGFSFAGKQLNFDDERSRLFFDYVRLLKACNPTYFLLENVNMKQEFQDVISNLLGVKPLKINSNLFSAQNRTRLYWTNIPVTKIKDKNIQLADILIDDADHVLRAGEHKIADGEVVFTGLAVNKKAITISDKYPHTFSEGRTDLAKELRSASMRETGRDTTLRSAEHRIYLPVGHAKANCLVCVENPLNLVRTKNYVRYLTITERERLQTLPDGYTGVADVSDGKRKRILGNGWTIDVIAHILKGVGKRPKKIVRQHSLLF